MKTTTKKITIISSTATLLVFGTVFGIGVAKGIQRNNDINSHNAQIQAQASTQPTTTEPAHQGTDAVGADQQAFAESISKLATTPLAGFDDQSHDFAGDERDSLGRPVKIPGNGKGVILGNVSTTGPVSCTPTTSKVTLQKSSLGAIQGFTTDQGPTTFTQTLAAGYANTVEGAALYVGNTMAWSAVAMDSYYAQHPEAPKPELRMVFPDAYRVVACTDTSATIEIAARNMPDQTKPVFHVWRAELDWTSTGWSNEGHDLEPGNPLTITSLDGQGWNRWEF